jgi:hypothetical protein
MRALKALGLKEVPSPLGGEHYAIETQMEKGMKDPVITRALDKWLSQNNEQGKKSGVVMLPADNPEIAKIINTVPEGKRATLISMAERTAQSSQIHQAQALNMMKEEAVVDGVAILAKVPHLQ